MTRFTTGGDALAEALIAQGVTTMFGIPGIQLDAACDALYYRRDRIRFICARNEQAVTYMADGYARSTGKEGVGMVVPGPGLLNALAGLATAYATNSRVLLIAGQIATDKIGKGEGVLHEIPDQSGIIPHLSKWSACATSAEQIPSLVEEAFRQLRSGRPRPVVLEVPPDVLAAPIPPDLAIAPYVSGEAVKPAEDTLRRAADMIAASARPLLYAGSGVRGAHASQALTDLAHLLNAPVVVTEEARGAIDARDPLAFDPLAFRKLRESADLIVSGGSRCLGSIGGPLNTAGTPYICINVDEADLGAPRKPALAVHSDAKYALERLTALMEGYRPAARDEEFKAARDFVADSLEAVRPQLAYMNAIRGNIPDDAVYVTELTQIGYVSGICYPAYAPETYINPGYEGTLGYGFSTALGAQAADMDRTVVSISGDGGFAWTMQELSTMAKYELPLIAIVFNDGYFGNVHRIQKNTYGGRFFASDLKDPDYMTLAEAYGIKGRRVTGADELAAVMREETAAHEPVLIEVRVGEFPSPWALIHEGI